MGTWMQARREELQLTQKAAGLRAGISESYWCLIEKGNRPHPPLDVVNNVARALEIDTALLVNELLRSAKPSKRTGRGKRGAAS